MMGNFFQDLKYGLRVMWKSRGFTAAAVLALALGIGVNTVIFGIVNGVLLRPLPYHDSSRLMSLSQINPTESSEKFPVSTPNFMDWKRQTTVFEQLAAYRSGSSASYNLTGEGGEPERIKGLAVGANVFATLGVNPLLGSTFQPEEDKQSGKSVVLSHNLWQRRFTSDPSIVGKTITLNGQGYAVVGVMPPAFEFPVQTERVEMWVPMVLTAEELGEESRGLHKLSVIARLKPGVTEDQAQAEMTTIARRLAEQYPEANANVTAQVVSMLDEVVGNIRPALFILLAAVGCVLLIACANVANLLLARASSRGKEIAIRVALGARRSRIIRQLLTESVLLALVGGVLGLLLAMLANYVLLNINTDRIPRLQEVGIDVRVLGFTFLVSLVTGVLFGIAPALQASKGNLNETLKEETGKASAGVHKSRIRSVLVVSEVALALLLLISAGLLIKSFLNLQKTNPGFNPHNVLTVRIPLPANKYSEPPQARAFYQQLLDRVKGLPGVEHAGVTTSIPLTGWNSIFGFEIPGRPAPPPGQTLEAEFIAISPGYMGAMGIPLLRGRLLAESDSKTSPSVIVINETMARRHWPNEEVIGKQVKVGPFMREIAGVVADVKQDGLNVPSREQMYASIYQVPSPASKILVVRSTSDPKTLIGALRKEVLAVDHDQPITSIRTMDEVFAESISKPRLYMILLSVFAAVALTLAVIGIYSVLAYSVTQRTQEIGIRMALGAQPRDVLRLVVGQGMLLALIGIVIGLVAAFFLSRGLASMIEGINSRDLMVFGGTPIVLAIVALLACLIPAWRAAKLSPILALRFQ
jgi:putative ABC transport system permease protein